MRYFSFTIFILLFSLPSFAVIGPVTGTSSMCVGSIYILTDTTAGGTWTSSNTSIATVGSSSGFVMGNAVGTATITYTVGSGYVTKTVTVNPLPFADTISGPSIVCTGATITLTDASVGGIWNATNTNASVSGGYVTGVSAGVDVIQYIVINSCGASIATKAITVNPSPYAGSITGPSVVCVAASITLTDTATGGTWSATSSNATVAGGTVTGVTSGSVDIHYTVTNSCGSAVAYIVMSVRELPVALAISGDSTVCRGGGHTFGLLSSSTGADSILWTSVYGHTSLPLPHSSTMSFTGVGISAGVDTIICTVINTCGSARITKTFTVDALPTVGIITGPSTLCIGTLIALSDTSGGGTWSASNSNATVVGGTVTGVTSGSVDIHYTVTNSCGSAMAIAHLTVKPLPGGIITGPSVICNSGTLYGLHYTGPLGDSTSFWWVATNSNAHIPTGGGLPVTVAISIEGVTPGLDTFVCRTTNTCGTAFDSITVTVVSLDAGSIEGPSSVCIGDTIHLSNTISGGVWGRADVLMHAGVDAAGVVNGNTAGPCTISYRVSNICGSATSYKTISVVDCALSVPPLAGRTPDILLYPNPTTNELTVTASDKITSIAITTLLGQTLYTYLYNAPQVQVDVSSLPPGIYLLRINGSEIRKFVKQ